jgi:hypothetical protein
MAVLDSTNWRAIITYETRDLHSRLSVIPRDITELTKRWLKQQVVAVTARLNEGLEAAVLCNSTTGAVLKISADRTSMHIGASEDGPPFGIDSEFTVYPFSDHATTFEMSCPDHVEEINLLAGIADRYGYVSSSSYEHDELCCIFSSENNIRVMDDPLDTDHILYDLREEHNETIWLVDAYRDDSLLSWGPRESMTSIEGDDGYLCAVGGRVCCITFRGSNAYLHDRRAAGPTTISNNAGPLLPHSSRGRDSDHLWLFRERTLMEFDWRSARWRERLSLPFTPRLTGYAAEFWI